MEKSATEMGMNKTGAHMSPKDIEKMMKGMPQGAPGEGDGSAIAAVRTTYIAEAEPVGTAPPPGTIKGAAKAGMQKLVGRHPEVLVDKLGERITLAGSYILLVGCCVGFATIPNPAILAAMLVAIRLLVLMNIGLSTYVNRLAPPEELTPTLSAGISINHVTSVGMPLLAAALLPAIGYNGIFLGTAGLIAASVPFTMMLRRPAAAPLAGGMPALSE